MGRRGLAPVLTPVNDFVMRYRWQALLLLGLSVPAVLPALAGMALGQALRKRISPTAFRRGFLVCFLLRGSEMLVRGI